MENQIEIWKDVIGYEGLYQVSNFGNIYSFLRKKKMKPHKTKKGYLRTCLRKNNKSIPFLVHRLVLYAFKDNVDDKLEVNHINGIKHDNRFENLEWVTSSENSIHAINLGLKIMKKGVEHGMSKLTEKEVLEIRAIGRSMTQKEIGKKYGIVHSQVGFILNRKQWKHI
jgi:hypothetical protein